MPDLGSLALALVAAGLTAALVLVLASLPWRRRSPARLAAGWVLAVGLGFALGVWLLGVRPHWLPREDQDRFLLVLLPAVVVVELVGALPWTPGWLAWTLRALVAAAVGRILLDGTSYLTDLAGPGSREWTPATTWLILGGLAVALTAFWAALAALGKRSGGTVSLALALTSGAAAVAVMLSGYASGGQLGLPLAAALTGAALAALIVPAPEGERGLLPVGVGVVGLFGLLLIGHCFGTLPVTIAALLACAPLLGWLLELPRVAQLRPVLRGGLHLLLVGGLLAFAVSQAKERYTAAAGPASPTKEASIDDYSNFGR